MAKDPAFLFYSNDFLTGTYTMSDKQVGQYIRLMCLQHQKGHLTEQQMLSVCKRRDDDIFVKFQQDENGLYFNFRLETEINKRVEHCKKQAEKKQKYWDDLKKKQIPQLYHGITGADTKTIPLENEIEIVNKEENIYMSLSNEGTKDARTEFQAEFSKVISLYLNRINNNPSPACIVDLENYAKDMGADVVCLAINTAIDAKALTWPYIRSILKGWSGQKVKSMADVERIEAERDKTKIKTGYAKSKSPAVQKQISPADEKAEYARMKKFLEEQRKND